MNPAAVAVPIVLLLLILAALIAVVWYRRYVCYLVALHYLVRADCKGYAMEVLNVFLRFKFMSSLYMAVARAILGSLRKPPATATGTSLNKRFNEQNNGCARTL